MKSVWPLALFVLSSCAVTHSLPSVASGEYDQCIKDAYYVTLAEYEQLLGEVSEECKHLPDSHVVHYPVPNTPCGGYYAYSGCFQGSTEEIWITQGAVLAYMFRVTAIHEWIHAIEHCAGSTRPVHTDNTVWGLVRQRAQGQIINSCPD